MGFLVLFSGLYALCTHIHVENFWLSCPKLFIFAICENYLQFGWSHFMITLFFCALVWVITFGRYVYLCADYIRTNIKCVCGALFSISKTTVYLNCSALQTHFVSCYILQRRFNVGFCSHSPFPDIYIFQCTRTVSYVPIHTYVVFHVLVNQQIKSRLCFLFVYSFASLSC